MHYFQQQEAICSQNRERYSWLKINKKEQEIKMLVAVIPCTRKITGTCSIVNSQAPPFQSIISIIAIAVTIATPATFLITVIIVTPISIVSILILILI
jgi:hypothetical protein